MASTYVAVDMASTTTVEVVGTRLIARKCEVIFHRKTSALEYRRFV